MNQWIGVQIIRIDRDPSDRRKERKFREDVLFVEEEEEGQKGGGGERKKEIWHGTRDVGTRHPSPLQHLKRFQRLRFFFSRKLNSCRYFNIVHEDDK